MASSTDFKIIHERYQSEGVSKGISIVQFCQMSCISNLAYLTHVLRQLRYGCRDNEALLPCNMAKVLA